MSSETTITVDDKHVDMALVQALERGIEDVESGRALPLDEAMARISEIRAGRKQIRACIYC